jgi:hypothetical protein
MRKIMTIMGAAIVSLVAYATADATDGPAYFGNKGCVCHRVEIADWAKSDHGNAFDQLLAANRSRQENKAMKEAGLDYKADYDTDPKCLACHTVGYGRPGGYAEGNMKDDLKGVGCESCHGPGDLYRVLHKEKGETFTRGEAAALGAVSPPTEKRCRTCHDNPSSVFSSKTDPKYGFDFNERMKRREAWHKEYPLLHQH